MSEAQTHTITGRTVTISEAPRFNKRSPARYQFRIVGVASFAQNIATYGSTEAALTAARVDLGVAPAVNACTCGRPATMNAALGRTCEDCFNNLSDAN